MAIKRIVRYELTEIPGFEAVKFTESSKTGLVLPKAVRFAAEQGAVLQSIREAAAFRIEANGEDNSDKLQATRTAAIYFRDKDRFYVAFDDPQNKDQNLIMIYARRGYIFSKIRQELVFPIKDDLVIKILERAEKNNRIVEVKSDTLEFILRAEFLGFSRFNSNTAAQALFCDIARPYAKMVYDSIRAKDKLIVPKGSINFMAPKELEKKLDSEKALIKPVSLGGDFYGIDYVDASARFSDKNFARGMCDH